tara:strand:- start:660 stop:914 length:255 start_codon:yes stop_codon:yes gene_type:complete
MNIQDVQVELVRAENTLDIDGYMELLNENINNLDVKKSINKAGKILDKHEKICLKGLWIEYIKTINEINNTGFTEVEDESTGEI